MLEVENSRFGDFFDAISLNTWILDPQGKVLKANQAAQKLTGNTQDKMIGVPIWLISWRGLSPDNRKTLKLMMAQAMMALPARNDLMIHLRGQEDMVINLSFKPILDEKGSTQFIFVEGRNITAYRRTSQALNQSEARFKTIFEEAGIGILIKEINGKMLDCNPAFQVMLGYSAEEISRFDYLQITFPPDRWKSRKVFTELVKGKRKNYVIEKRYMHIDGRPIWARVTASLVHVQDHEGQFVIAIVENINTQKEIENELSELQRRLMRGRETERLQLAQELHDGPLQELIDITFQLKELEDPMAEAGKAGQLQNVLLSINVLARSIRTICGELRPPTLVPFGLEKTIRSHADQFQEAHPEIKIHLDLDEDGQSLSEPIRIVLFRIYQVALNNILRHAQANQVKIQFRLEDGQAVLKVQDNGKGFELPDRWINLARQGHLGIVGARERAKEVGGEVDVITKIGKGTTIHAVVPLNEELRNYSEKEEIR